MAPKKTTTKEQTMQYNGKEKKRQKNKPLCTKHHTENERSSNTNSTKTGSELGFSRRVSSSCSTRGVHRVTLVTNPALVLP